MSSDYLVLGGSGFVGSDRPGHDRRYALDDTKLRKELGWKPSLTFDQALSETVKWYVGNSWWWKPLGDAYSFV